MPHDSEQVDGTDDTDTDSELVSDAVDVGIIKSETPYTIRFLARLADPKGDVRKMLGIEEVLSISERKLLGSKNF